MTVNASTAKQPRTKAPTFASVFMVLSPDFAHTVPDRRPMPAYASGWPAHGRGTASRVDSGLRVFRLSCRLQAAFHRTTSRCGRRFGRRYASHGSPQEP